MKVIEKISEIIGKYMAVIVLAVAALALFVPQSSLWINTSWINYLLMIVMFGMGLTMKPKDFALIFKRPKDIIIGCAAQFIIMPALAFRRFSRPRSLGCCCKRPSVSMSGRCFGVSSG